MIFDAALTVPSLPDDVKRIVLAQPLNSMSRLVARPARRLEPPARTENPLSHVKPDESPSES
jgi:hypothetical protein